MRVDPKIGATENIVYQMWLGKASEWKDGSEKLYNPGKHFVLKLAMAAVQYVKSERQSNGLNYAREAMTQCGMALKF